MDDLMKRAALAGARMMHTEDQHEVVCFRPEALAEFVREERERCAKLVETTPAEAFATVMHQGQLQRARETFAAAIRKG